MAISQERKLKSLNMLVKMGHWFYRGQVAVLTADINEINAHLSVHKKDFHSQRGLMKKIGHRRNLLAYLRRTDIKRYRDLIQSLGLRR